MEGIHFDINVENISRWNKTLLDDAIWNNPKQLFEKLQLSAEYTESTPSKRISSSIVNRTVFSMSQPTEEQLNEHLTQTLLQQQKFCNKETPFSLLLRQRILVVTRILIGLARSSKEKEKISSKKSKNIHSSSLLVKENSKKSSSSPLLDLSVKTGIRLIFILLKECWELDDGIDSDICREFIQNVSEILGNLPKLSLYDTEMSSLSKNTLDNIDDFLKKIILPSSNVNESDKISSLSLLSSFCGHRGSLSCILSFISYLQKLPNKDTIPYGSILSLLDQMEDYKIQKNKITKGKKNEKLCNDDNIIDDIDDDDYFNYNNIDKDHINLFKKISPKISSKKSKLSLICNPKILSFEILKKLYFLSSLFHSPIKKSSNLKDGSDVYIWGCRNNGKLGTGEEESSRIKEPQFSSIFSDLNPIQIILGSSMTMLIDYDGKVYSLGKGDYGRLGLGSNSDVYSPTEVDFGNTPINKIFLSTTSYGHGVAIDENREIWSWGDGDYGKLGHNSTDQQGIPKKISFFKDKYILTASCGPKHTAVVTEDGKVYTFGLSEGGRLGYNCSGLSDSCTIPKNISTLNQFIISDIACGDIHCIATSINSNHTWTWGDGSDGRLGLGRSVSQSDIPELVSELENIKIIQLIAGDGYSCALTENGKIYCFGEKFSSSNPVAASLWLPYLLNGDLKNENIIIKQISGGKDHILALSEDNRVFSVGKNSSRQCGLPNSPSEVLEPTEIKILSDKNIRQISAGSAHSIAWTAEPINKEFDSIKSAPYCIELSKNTFLELKKLIENHYPNSNILNNEYEKEICLISCLRILSTNFHHIGTTQTDIILDIGIDNNLLKYFKDILLDMLHNSLNSELLKKEVQFVFQTGWKILLPSVKERCELLLELLPKNENNSNNNNFNNFYESERFLVELLVTTLIKDNEMAAYLGLIPSQEPLDNIYSFDDLSLLLKYLIDITENDILNVLNNNNNNSNNILSLNGLLQFQNYIQKYCFGKLINHQFSLPPLPGQNNNLKNDKSSEVLNEEFKKIINNYFILMINSTKNIINESIKIIDNDNNNNKNIDIINILKSSIVYNGFSQFLFCTYSVSSILENHFNILNELLNRLDILCSKLDIVKETEDKEMIYHTELNDKNFNNNSCCWLLDLERTLATFLGRCCNIKIQGKTLSIEEKEYSNWLEKEVIRGGLASENYKMPYYSFIEEFIGYSKLSSPSLSNISKLIEKINNFARNKLWLVGKDDKDELLLKTQKLILICLLKHHGCIEDCILFGKSDNPNPSTILSNIFQGVFIARDKIHELKLKQDEEEETKKQQQEDEEEENYNDYDDSSEDDKIENWHKICDPIIDRCNFLLFDLTAANPKEEIKMEEKEKEENQDEFFNYDDEKYSNIKLNQSIELKNDIHGGAGVLILPQSSPVPSPSIQRRDDSDPRMKRSSSYSSSYSSSTTSEMVQNNEKLATVLSMMRKFSWIGKSNAINTVTSLRDSIIDFILSPIKLLDLKKSISHQQNRAEIRLLWLENMYNLITSSKSIPSVRCQLFVGSYNLWMYAPTPSYYLDNIPASLKETQTKIQSSYHKLFIFYLDILKNDISNILNETIDINNNNNDNNNNIINDNINYKILKENSNIDKYLWDIHYILHSFVTPFRSSDIIALVNGGIVNILRNLLNPIYKKIFGNLRFSCTCWLHSILSTIGSESSRIPTRILSEIEKLLRELLEMFILEDNSNASELLCVLRRICISSSTVELFSSPSWTNLLIKIINTGTLQDRIMALRFLEIILKNWKIDTNHSRISLMLEELLRILSVNLSLPQIPETLYAVTNFASFDKSYCKSALVDDDGLSFTQTESTRISDPGYVYGMIPMSSGKYRWEFQINNDASDDETVCIGVGRKPLTVLGFEKSPDLWLLRGYNGKLYHTCVLSGKEFEGFTVNDRIAIEVDMDIGTVSYFKNDTPLGIAFENITGTVYPVVLFYGGSTRARVSLIESGCNLQEISSKVKSKSQLFSVAAPIYTAFCEEIIFLIKKLHELSWGRYINQFLTKQCRSLLKSYEKFKNVDSSFQTIYVPPLTKSDSQGELLSALSILGGIENGFRHGGIVLHDTYGKGCASAFLCPDHGEHSILVCYESNAVKMEFAKQLHPISTPSFNGSKLLLSRSELRSVVSVIKEISLDNTTIQQSQIQLLLLRSINVLLNENENLNTFLIGTPLFYKLLDLSVLETSLKILLNDINLEKLVSLLYKDVSTLIASFGNIEDLENPRKSFSVTVCSSEIKDSSNNNNDEKNIINNDDDNNDNDDNNDDDNNNEKEKLKRWFKDDIINNNNDIFNNNESKESLKLLCQSEFKDLMTYVLDYSTDKQKLLYQCSRSLQIQYSRNIIVKILSQHPRNNNEEPLIDLSSKDNDNIIQKLGILVRIIASGNAGINCKQKLSSMVTFLLECSTTLSEILITQCINGFLDASNESNNNNIENNNDDKNLEKLSGGYGFLLSQSLLPSLIQQESLSNNIEWNRKLIDALASCVNSNLTEGKTTWAALRLSSLCLHLYERNGQPSQDISEWKNNNNIVPFVSKLPELIEIQYKKEIERHDMSERIFFSDYLQSIATLYFIFPQQKSKIKEINSYVIATSIVRALASRKSFPDSFLEETRKLAIENELDENELGFSDNKNIWNLEMDEQVIRWRAEHPQDWKRPVNSIVIGCNSHGQLSIDLDQETISNPIDAPYINNLNPQIISCGNNCSFILTQDGSLYSCGQGKFMRLGLGNSDNSPTLKFLRTLQGITITNICASKGSYGHALAIDSQGRIWSWGDGDHGKLGHGDTEQQKIPKIIDFLKFKKVTHISCGFTHSACIADGKLFTWGEKTWTGHSSSSDITIPTLVDIIDNNDNNINVSLVECGELHTIVVSEDRKRLWSFGDGEDGKLGLGDETSYSKPKEILLNLLNLEIEKIEIGSKCSFLLSKCGKVYCWGKGSYGCLGLGDTHSRIYPTIIDTFIGMNVEDISAGISHVIAIIRINEKRTEVYSWGQNDEGQLGINNLQQQQVLSPTRIKKLSKNNFSQVCSGNNHSILWTMKKKYKKPFYPKEIPVKYDLLQNLSPISIYFRFHVLRKFSSLVYEALPFFNINPLHDRYLSHGLDKLRSLLHTSGKISLLRAWVSVTNLDKEIGPTIILNRYAVNKKKGQLLFAQAAKQLPSKDARELRASKRAWKVQFAGEGADDVGGPYNESLSEMCIELQSLNSPLFTLTRNGLNREGDNQDRYVLKPSTSKGSLKLYRFFGIFLGVAIRTKNPLSLYLAPIFWKQLLSIPLNVNDLKSVDKSFVTTYSYLLDIDQYGIIDEESFSLLPLDPFQPLDLPGNQKLELSYANRKEYVEKAIQLKLENYCKDEFEAIREGLSQMVPLSLFSLFTPTETENLVCGSPTINWNVLKVNTLYKGTFTESSKQCIWLWEVLEELDSDDRASFLRFVWGHTRLPSDPADIRQHFIVQSANSSPPDSYLPYSQTCFFKIVLPLYTTKEILSEKLIYAIRFCKSIDTDDYARHNIAE